MYDATVMRMDLVIRRASTYVVMHLHFHWLRRNCRLSSVRLSLSLAICDAILTLPFFSFSAKRKSLAYALAYTSMCIVQVIVSVIIIGVIIHGIRRGYYLMSGLSILFLRNCSIISKINAVDDYTIIYDLQEIDMCRGMSAIF